MKALKKITFTLLISSTLAFSGWAGSGDYWNGQKEKEKEKEKEKKKSERVVEKDKKKNEDQGGSKKDEGGKKGKKPND